MYIDNEVADKLIPMINTEMNQILSEGRLSKEVVCLLGEMVDILKDVKELEEGSEDEGYSYDGYDRSYRGHSRRRSYDGMNNMSYNRRNDGGSSYRRGYSRGSERDHLMEKMDQFMAQASSESERQLVRRIMDEL